MNTETLIVKIGVFSCINIKHSLSVDNGWLKW